MSQDSHTKLEDNYLKAKALTRNNTPVGIIERISKQLDRCDAADERIKKEGIVVRDMKGSVIQHPAIKIEIEAGKVITDLLKKYGC